MTNHELNNLVAEKIMGWKLDLSDWKTSDNQFTMWDVYDWEPSENIRCAWMVVEKFSRGPWHVFICDTHSDNWKSCLIRSSVASPYPPEEIFYGLMPYKRDDKNLGLKEFKAQTESVPKSICLAALKAVGVNV